MGSQKVLSVGRAGSGKKGVCVCVRVRVCPCMLEEISVVCTVAVGKVRWSGARNERREEGKSKYISTPHHPLPTP